MVYMFRQLKRVVEVPPYARQPGRRGALRNLLEGVVYEAGEIVLEAVKQTGFALQYADDSLRDDDEGLGNGPQLHIQHICSDNVSLKSEG